MGTVYSYWYLGLVCTTVNKYFDYAYHYALICKAQARNCQKFIQVMKADPKDFAAVDPHVFHQLPYSDMTTGKEVSARAGPGGKEGALYGTVHTPFRQRDL